MENYYLKTNGYNSFFVFFPLCKTFTNEMLFYRYIPDVMNDEMTINSFNNKSDTMANLITITKIII